MQCIMLIIAKEIQKGVFVLSRRWVHVYYKNVKQKHDFQLNSRLGSRLGARERFISQE